MKIISATNTDGQFWELAVDEDPRKILSPCERVVSRYREGGYLDTGSAIVLWTMSSVVRVDAAGTGWVPTATHILERKVSCECVCHRGP
jgi:hypothetical protein